MKRIKKLSFVFIIVMVLFFTVSCSCSPKYLQQTTVNEELNKIIDTGTSQTSISTNVSSLVSNLKTLVVEKYSAFATKYCIETISEDTTNFIYSEKNNLQSSVKSFEVVGETTVTYTELDILTNASNNLEAALQALVTKLDERSELASGNHANDIASAKEEVTSYSLLVPYLKQARALANGAFNEEDFKKDENKLVLFTQDVTTANEELNALDITIDPTLVTEETSYNTLLCEKANEVKTVIVALCKNLSTHNAQPEPIQFRLNSFGDFFSYFFTNFFVYPVGWLMWALSKLFGGHYVIGLILTTLIIRTVGWPIYTRTNDMTLKMKMMEPEQAKIQEKYARRQDPESQRMMQMEMAQLYKKYGVGVGGCILPFLQFPIFIAIFRAVQRFPYTNGFLNSPDWVSGLNVKFIGINLFEERGAFGNWQFWGVIILCVLVAGTQILQQLITNKRQKQVQDDAQSDIPAYRRQAVSQQNQTGKSMQMFMWVMVAMMVVFVFQSKAGLGVYWLVGNLYALLQSYIGNKTSAKRLEKLKAKQKRY